MIAIFLLYFLEFLSMWGVRLLQQFRLYNIKKGNSSHVKFESEFQIEIIICDLFSGEVLGSTQNIKFPKIKRKLEWKIAFILRWMH